MDDQGFDASKKGMLMVEATERLMLTRNGGVEMLSP